MNLSTPSAAGVGTSYELRFPGLFNAGRGYAFPCDAKGCVDIDALSDSGRTNYFYARAVVGRELASPVTRPVGGAGAAEPSRPGQTRAWRD